MKPNIGDSFNRWTIIGHGSKPYHSQCLCICGTIREVNTYSLIHNNSKSCGCLTYGVPSINSVTHGESNTRLCRIWYGIRARCLNPNVGEFRHYGGRGITIDEEWSKYTTFRDWALISGYNDTLEIDRIDNNGPYNSDNCRWVTKSVNARNRRVTRTVMAWNEVKPILDWLDDPRCNIIAKRADEVIRYRLKMGWTAEEAISQPKGTRSKWILGH